MLSKINALKISFVFIFGIVLLYSHVVFAQDTSVAPIDLGRAIQVKTSYNKKIIRGENCSLDGLAQNDSQTTFVPLKLAARELGNLSVYELVTDTVISIRAETENHYNLIAEMFDDLKYDDNYYLESYSNQDQINRVAVFTDIYKRVRIVFIKLNNAEYCIID